MKNRSFIAMMLSIIMCFGIIGTANAETTTYTGTAPGFGNLPVTVTVTLEDGKVVGLDVDDSNQTYAAADIAKEDSVDVVVAGILADGSAENYPVDTLSTATYTTNAIINVVNEALAGGKADLSNVEIAFTPGTYTGNGKGRAGNIEVNVTVSENSIIAIEVGANAETVGLKDFAFIDMRDEILANQSLSVDTVAGATMTCSGFLTAVTDALTQASNQMVVAALREVPVAKEVPAAQDLETEVVVVGAGMAGLSAALTLSEQGTDVILVEKMPYVGGNLFLAGGGLGTVESKHVEDDGFDRTIAFMKKVNETSSRQPDYDFLEKMLYETGRAVDWLIDDYGLDHSPTGGDYVLTYFGSAEDRSGAAFTKQLDELVRKQGTTVLLNTKAESIVMKDGKAAGVKVSNESGEFNISAKKVIIATGGASHDWDRLVAANPELNTVKFFEEAAVSSTGDGFRMMEEVGAQMDAGPFVKSAKPDLNIAFGYTFRNTPGMANQLVVNAEGNRVTNESPYNPMYLNKQLLNLASPAYYVIFQADMMADYFLADADRLAVAEDNNVVVKADTLEELAVKMDVSYDNLRASFDRYNELCAAGEDADFGKDASHLIAYKEDAPLYAVRVYVGSWGTIGGVVTDDTFHVVNTSGEVIDNLFAIGECSTARLFGDYYFGGFSLGFYTAAGHIAGETAMAEIQAQ